MPVGYFKLYTYFTVFQITLSMNMVYVMTSKNTWGIADCRMKCDYFYKTMLQKSVRKKQYKQHQCYYKWILQIFV